MAEGQTKLLRHSTALPTSDSGRAAAISTHLSVLADLAEDGNCIRRALPDQHPEKRLMLARSRLEKAALTLDETSLEELSKHAAALLRRHEQQVRQRLSNDDVAAGMAAEDDARIQIDVQGRRVVLGDLLLATRETAARELLEGLRDHVLSYGRDDVEHVLRANGRLELTESWPRWSGSFGDEQFAQAAPRLVKPLNEAFAARTDRTDGKPLIPNLIEQPTTEQRDALKRCFNRWREHRRPEEVAEAELETLAKAMLVILGADRDAAKNLFRAAYMRDVMRDRKLAAEVG